MALDRFGVELFLLLKQHGISLESILTFGRQHFSIPPKELSDVQGLAEIAGDQSELAREGDRFADPFFKALGAKTADSLDASDYESCSRVHDLNEVIPESWHAGYDVVFDGGTLEHVFHFPNAITNAMNLVKPGGVLITQSPSNNLNGHGFYQFSPELFFRLFNRANGFQILLLAFVESDRPYRKYRVEDPKSLGSRITFGGHGPLQLIMIARREEVEVPLSKPPYQSDYSASWKTPEKSLSKKTGDSPPHAKESLKQRLRRWLPAGWIRRYEQARYEQRRKRHSMAGVSEVRSLDECFQNGGHPSLNQDPSELPTNAPS